MLAVLFFFSVANCVRSAAQARFLLRLLLIGGAIAALIELVLFALPDGLALQLLVSLGRIGYPTTSGRVLRFVADDPSGVERAVGLAVDPNSYGGMLALIGALAVTQAVAERPLLPRRWLYPIAGVLALATFLTQSRGALGGLVAGALYVAALRYRRLWWPVAGGAALVVLLYLAFGIGDQFVTRVTEGVQFRDQANQMRLDEYRNALEIISRYPVFGIGFGASGPDIDLGVGVSSIYLALAERVTALVGLFWFVGLIAAFFLRSLPAIARRFARGQLERGGALLGLQAAIAAAMAVGLLDHYFSILSLAIWSRCSGARSGWRWCLSADLCSKLRSTPPPSPLPCREGGILRRCAAGACAATNAQIAVAWCRRCAATPLTRTNQAKRL